MKLILRKWDDKDLYAIERAEHSGERRDVPTKYGVALWTAARVVSNGLSCVEGSAREMLDIASAIERRGSQWHERCAVEVRGDDVNFWSPRNSNGAVGTVTVVEADDLAKIIRSMCGKELS